MKVIKKPHCLGFIMDGNRRWAEEHGRPTLEGHMEGQRVFMECVRFLRDEGISHGVFYAFSTENWKRSEKEVEYLMYLFSKIFSELATTIGEEGVRVRIIGRREDFNESLQIQMKEVEDKSKSYKDTTVWIALSYGGRAEIIDAVNHAIEKRERVDESSFSQLLQTAELPDSDMIIRTSGEQRLSNFLPWQSVYSEFYFIEKHWPALTKVDFEDILLQYAKRTRRHGA